ncbi:glycosyltransferase family 4 protein [Jejudonia soesokkakensis]|uniref:Glycosyltransferase family 4 protein n=1 Tax=Jejudonia soesokkakensis TaxID=1323432 RepID=A0ABW2MML4_9FLAO
METKRILLVTNYFPPEKGAASNRLWSLAEGLSKKGYDVQVVCPLPNYPQGVIFSDFKGSFYKKRIANEITIHRLWLWPSNSPNKFFRLLSMLSFSLSLSLFFILKTLPKKIVVQYSPVFVGFTAVFYGWLFRKRIILNVSDLWPLAGLEMGLLKKGFYYSLLEKMERFCYKKADLIIGQSEEILEHIKKLVSKKDTFLYRNLPNFEPIFPKEKVSTAPIRIVYAGLLGVAQGVFKICNQIKFPSTVELHIYGAGPEASAIKSIENLQIKYHGEVSREELHQVLSTYDVAFIPLVNRIYGSVPSKIFEYTRLGVPVLYYAGGEGGDLVKMHQLGWTIPVKNEKELQKFIDAFSEIKLTEYPKESVQQKAIEAFDFDKQFDLFIRKISAI